jgi:glycerate 2-kinase
MAVTFHESLYQQPGVLGLRRRQIIQVMQAALDAVDPADAVARFVKREGHWLDVAGCRYDLEEYDRVCVVGAGKAGAPMATAVERVVGDRIGCGIVNVKYGHVLPTERIVMHEAGHPIPDEAGVAGAQQIAALLHDTGERDLVLCLISGGGSALMTLPVEGITLADMKALTDALLRVGATINEINTIRKHLERIKGGNLARLAYPARVIALILSDVVGNPLDVIASGPTVADSSTFAQAYGLVQRYELEDVLPRSIVRHLQRGAAGEVPDTPKPGDPTLNRTQNVIVASNELAAAAAEAEARRLGFHTMVLSTFIEGEAREVARVFAAIAREIAASDRPVARPACLIAGGETTVTLRGRGRGGRNQELALAAALRIQGLDDVIIVSLATDGTDGPTDASGALADGQTVQRAAACGLDAQAHLDRNDAYPFFAALDNLLLTGPTNTNVNDLIFTFVW